MTFWHKKIFPVFWFGSLALFTVAAFPLIAGGAPVFVLFVPLFMAVFGYVFMRWLIFPLADEVFLTDDEEIVVRKGAYEDRFPISNIINVDSSMLVNPERITLTLEQPCTLGSEVIFSPPIRLWSFSRHPLALELIKRAHQARTEKRP